MVRVKLVAGGVALMLAAIAFAALAGEQGSPHSLVLFRTALAQSSDKLSSLESKLKGDQGRLGKVIHRLGEIKDAEAQIKKDQSKLLAQERATRASMHTTRNRMVALKYKIHNIKAVDFSNSMFGLSADDSKKAKAHASLQRKAKELEDGQKTAGAPNVQKAPNMAAKKVSGTAQFEKIINEVKAELKDASAKHAVHAAAPKPKHIKQTSVTHTQASKNAAIIAEGIRRAKVEMETMRQKAKAKAHLALQRKAATQEVAASGFDRGKPAVARASTRRVEARESRVVSRMQAQVLRKRMADLTQNEPVPAQAARPLAYKPAPSPQRPHTLENAADMAAAQAEMAQRMAYMRSPQYWASKQPSQKMMKRYGMMPGLPLLAPLDPAAADA